MLSRICLLSLLSLLSTVIMSPQFITWLDWCTWSHMADLCLMLVELFLWSCLTYCGEVIYFRLVFIHTHTQFSPCLTDVYLVTVVTCYSVYHSCLVQCEEEAATDHQVAAQFWRRWPTLPLKLSTSKWNFSWVYKKYLTFCWKFQPYEAVWSSKKNMIGTIIH